MKTCAGIWKTTVTKSRWEKKYSTKEEKRNTHTDWGEAQVFYRRLREQRCNDNGKRSGWRKRKHKLTYNGNWYSIDISSYFHQLNEKKVLKGEKKIIAKYTHFLMLPITTCPLIYFYFIHILIHFNVRKRWDWIVENCFCY